MLECNLKNDRVIEGQKHKATTDGMVKSVWQTTGFEHQFVPGPLCVQPEMLSLLGCEPREGICVIIYCTVIMCVDSGQWTDDVESVNPAPDPVNFSVLSHSVLIFLAKADTPLIRFALEIRNPEILGSCFLFLLTGAVFFWPTRVSTGIHLPMHIHTDI